MTDDIDILTKVRLELAEMKGMLSQFVASNELRVQRLEVTITEHTTKLSEKRVTIARHDERITETENDIIELKKDNASRQARNLALVASIVGVLGLALAVFNSFRFS